MSESMLALSLVQPMGWAIVARHKPIENRVWPALRRGVDGLAKIPAPWKRRPELDELVAIHAAKRRPDPAYTDMVLRLTGLRELPPAASITSAIIGVARIVDVITEEPAVSQLRLGDEVAPADHARPAIRSSDWSRLVSRFGTRTQAASRWFVGPHALVLADARELEHPIGNVKGALYFWPLAPSDDRTLRAQLAAA